MAFAPRFGRYGFQLRTVVLLGVLFLFVLDVLNLFQLADDRRRIERLTRLDLASRTAAAAEWLGEDALRASLGGPPGLSPIGGARLEEARARFGFRALALTKPDGRARVQAGATPVEEGTPPELTIRAPAGPARTVPGRLDAGGDPSQAWVEGWWPVVDDDGSRLGALKTWAPATDWGRVNLRVQQLLWIQGIALALVAVLGAFFSRWLLQPFRALARAADEAGLSPEGPEPEDPEALAASIRRAAATLAAQQRDLERLEAEPSRFSDLVRFAESGGRSMTTGLLVVDADAVPRATNPAARRLLGWPSLDVTHWGGRESLRERVRICLTSAEPSSRAVVEWRGVDDRVWVVGVSIAPCLDDDEGVEGALVLMTDLTEIRELQERARLREGLASVGELSAGIAHEVRNALGTILGYAKMLRKRGEPDVATPAQAILDEIGGLRKTLDAFLQYARPKAPQWEPVDLDALLDELIAEASGVEVRRLVDFGTIEGDRDLLRGAFRNLISNVEALGRAEGRMLTLRIDGDALAGTRVLRFEDDGPGVAEEDRGRIFQPFYSRREGGTGLGLAWVQRAIVDHGGDVRCREGRSGGACFELRLPEKTPDLVGHL